MYGLFFHQEGYAHDTGAGHPERSSRLGAVQSAFARYSALLSGDKAASELEARQAKPQDLTRVHEPAYIERILSHAEISAPTQLDADTWLSPGSVTAALGAAGSGLAAVEAVLSGDLRQVFCGVRPPGHHAEPAVAMGFCLFNSIAVAGQAALQSCDRIAILDFDVHHGNGTQAMMWNEPRAFFASSHEMPLYPGTGAALECGGHNNILNAPLEAGSGDEKFLEVWEETLLPQVRNFKPDLILVSAGFDAHVRDPLANLRVSSQAFGLLGQRIAELASDVCNGRIVSLLEGGYDLIGLEEGLLAYLTGLAGLEADD